MVPHFLSPSKLIGAICSSFLSFFSPSSGEDVPFLRSKDMLTVTPHFPNLVTLMIPSLYFYLQLTPFNKQTLSSLVLFFWAISLNYWVQNLEGILDSSLSCRKYRPPTWLKSHLLLFHIPSQDLISGLNHLSFGQLWSWPPGFPTSSPIQNDTFLKCKSPKLLALSFYISKDS